MSLVERFPLILSSGLDRSTDTLQESDRRVNEMSGEWCVVAMGRGLGEVGTAWVRRCSCSGATDAEPRHHPQPPSLPTSFFLSFFTCKKSFLRQSNGGDEGFIWYFLS